MSGRNGAPRDFEMSSFVTSTECATFAMSRRSLAINSFCSCAFVRNAAVPGACAYAEAETPRRSEAESKRTHFMASILHTFVEAAVLDEEVIGGELVVPELVDEREVRAAPSERDLEIVGLGRT